MCMTLTTHFGFTLALIQSPAYDNSRRTDEHYYSGGLLLTPSGTYQNNKHTGEGKLI
jgi:hypothetical protein